MEPMYVRKADPKDRVSWMDKFIAQEPKGGFRDVIELARHGRSKAIFTAILAIKSEAGKAAA